MPFAALGVFKPGSVLAGKADDENVVPAILVEVIGPGKEVVGVSVLGAERAFKSRHLDGGHGTQLQIESRLRWIILVTFLEIGSFPPPGTRDDVINAVAIQVAEIGSL